MDKLQKYIDAFRKLPEGCKSAELNAVFTEEVSVTAAKGDIEDCSAFDRNALYLRATGEKTGSAYTESLEDEPEKLISRALENAESISAAECEPMLPGRRDVCGEEREGMSTEELMAFAIKTSKLPALERCTVTMSVRRCRVLNSNGLDTALVNRLYTLDMSVFGKGEDNYKNITRSSERLSDIDISDMLETIARESGFDHEELPYISLPAGKYDAVISSAMTKNMMNTIWQLFMKRLMDDGRSIMKPNERIGSAALNIVDAARSPYTGYDFSIDAEGVRANERTEVVKAGVIENPLCTLREGESTGNAGRDDLLGGTTRTNLIPIPRNIWIEPGEKSPSELVAQMKTGLHLTYSIDEFHSTNIASGTFSIPCGGVYYENGIPKGRVQQMNMYGSFRDLFGALEAAGNDVSMLSMEFYNSYCFGGPSLLVRGADFAM